MTQGYIDENKNNDSTDTSTTKFFGTVSCYEGFK